MHFELGYDVFFVLRGKLEGQIIYERFFGNNRAAGVNRGVACHALEMPCRIYHLFAVRAFLVYFGELRNLFKRIFKVEIERYELGYLVAESIAQPDGSSRVPHRRPGSHGSEGYYLRHVVFAVFLAKIGHDFVPSLVCEINIHIRHLNSFRIEKSLEKKAVFQGVYVRYAENIGSDAAGRRSASGTNRYAVIFCPVYHVGHDKEVIRKPGLFYYAEFIFQALFHFRCLFFRRKAVADFFIYKLAEVFIGCFAFRFGEIREDRFSEPKLEVAPLRYFYRVEDGLRRIFEPFSHLLR